MPRVFGNGVGVLVVGQWQGDCDSQFDVGHYYYRLREFKKAYNWWLKIRRRI